VLSRIAHVMYELARHIERAENTTRILDVNHRMSLERAYYSDLDVWSPILAISGSREMFDSLYSEISGKNVYDFLLLSEDNPNSVLCCLRFARESARMMREQISEEMWGHLNRMHMELAEVSLEQVVGKGSSNFNYRIQSFCNGWHGLADNTMVHGQAWLFLRLGRFLERGLMTSHILEIKYHLLLPTPDEVGRPLDLHQWQALLRSVSGYEAYRRLHKAKIAPARVIDLLLFSQHFPRSMRFCIGEVANALAGIGANTKAQRQLHVLVEDFLAELSGGKGDLMLAEGIKLHLDAMQLQCEEIHLQIMESYLQPAILLDEKGRELAFGRQAQQQ